jgi:methyl-accepting chemotaxis protein
MTNFFETTDRLSGSSDLDGNYIQDFNKLNKEFSGRINDINESFDKVKGKGKEVEDASKELNSNKSVS